MKASTTRGRCCLELNHSVPDDVRTILLGLAPHQCSPIFALDAPPAPSFPAGWQQRDHADAHRLAQLLDDAAYRPEHRARSRSPASPAKPRKGNP